MNAARRPVHHNPSARSWDSPPTTNTDLVGKFHTQLPDYRPTNLASLGQVAQELGVGAVLIKDESNRLGLPSFKILGASWGSFRAIARDLGLPLETDIETVKRAAGQRNMALYAATEGNHGRAVARMGAILELKTDIHVPVTMYAATIELIRSEGASVVVSTGNYDQAVLEAREASKHEGGILVQDFAFEGYEDVPQWIVDGYGTMMREIDQQLPKPASLVITPVGVGSFAQSVVSHYKRQGSKTAVMSVEPDTAACFYKSARRGEFTAVETPGTIMAGLNCATPSTIAWPLLYPGTDASATVSDFEAHEAALALQKLGVNAGPCGAAGLAALRRLTADDKAKLGLDQDSVVVLLCTEGNREYHTPLSVASDDPVELTQTLVQINSASPTLGSVAGPGETEIARYISAWLEHRDIEAHWIEPTKGRPSVVGVARGTGGGKSLMFNGHSDTVTLQGYEGDPLSGHIEHGKMYGRGTADMKSGLAAAMVALANAKKSDLRGDVILAAVADEEDASIGTEEVLQAGWRADAALVNEPTDVEIVHAHRGFVWLDVTIHGVAYHGSRPDKGVDAIARAGYFLAEFDRYAKRLLAGPADPTVGLPGAHTGTVRGGEETSSYPARCTISIERRTVPGETAAAIKQEIEELLQTAAKELPDPKYDVEVTFQRSPFALPVDDPFTTLVKSHVSKVLGKEATVAGAPYWTDCALLADAGIPSLLWGPKGAGLHAKTEWVDVESIKAVADGLTSIAEAFCK